MFESLFIEFEKPLEDRDAARVPDVLPDPEGAKGDALRRGGLHPECEEDPLVVHHEDQFGRVPEEVEYPMEGKIGPEEVMLVAAPLQLMKPVNEKGVHRLARFVEVEEGAHRALRVGAT